MKITSIKIKLLTIFIALLTGTFVSPLVHSHDYKKLTIDGSYSPFEFGTFPVTTNYSWLWYEFLGGARLTWHYGAGTMGGITFNQPQSHPPYDNNGKGTLYGDAGELGGNFLFLNEYSVLYSANNGIQIDDQNTIDMRNLRLFRGNVESDIGAGILNSQVPLINDINTLIEPQSGWQLYPDNSYDLVFYTQWLDAPMAIHFHGEAIPAIAPEISGYWPASANAGEFIFVFGSDFEIGNTQVNVNNINVYISQVITEDMLIFILPGGDTNGPINVTTHHGSASILTQVVNGLYMSGIWPGNAAAKGDFVFIFGSGFNNPLTLTIGNTAIPVVQVVGEDMLIFQVPQDAVTGNITITSNNQSITSSNPYTILP